MRKLKSYSSLYKLQDIIVNVTICFGVQPLSGYNLINYRSIIISERLASMAVKLANQVKN